MPPMLRALPWAIAILAIAFLGAVDVIPADVASTLVTVLPLIMVTTVVGSRRCRPLER
ncbi:MULTISPECIES: hypothetical protein [unclassified Sphingopyxis]|uniref:hypothetical protein n=1 Tax=unclassified Sphingopyxis TaxID=2614943 RepID=UPI000DC63B38|nr:MULTISPECIES: hypothetical protein [unclassified Sphingopyxis]BBB07809.1 glycine/betaine transport system permease protein [Sphingopyxis sp. EG6]